MIGALAFHLFRDSFLLWAIPRREALDEKKERLITTVLKQKSYIASFDSAGAMLRALANYLHGRDFPLLGASFRWRGFDTRLTKALNRLPDRAKEQLYIWSGRSEAVSAAQLKQADMNRISQWAASLYPRRKYPAVAIGSSNGALTHLWAALGIPWLPQTFLIPVARSGPHPDEPLQDIQCVKEWGETFLRANPDVRLHHMHDPNQDRLMIHRMSYFRVKKLRLGEAYERFLEECLAPGGTLIIVECGIQWPTTRIGERYIFQFGALGGATPDEYYHGGPRVVDYLRRYHSHRTRWNPPEPDARRPEAEWGFDSPMKDDIERFADRHRFRVRRMLFEQPEDMSPLVADFYKAWNEKRGLSAKRLLVESFIVMAPYWTIRSGSVPFWMLFNKQPSAEALEAYLNARTPFDEIYMMLFSHGVESIGLTPVQRWHGILGRARNEGRFVGVDEAAYPRDLAVFVRYYFELQRQIRSRCPMPPPLALDQLDEFLKGAVESYPVQWL